MRYILFLFILILTSCGNIIIHDHDGVVIAVLDTRRGIDTLRTPLEGGYLPILDSSNTVIDKEICNRFSKENTWTLYKSANYTIIRNRKDRNIHIYETKK